MHTGGCPLVSGTSFKLRCSLGNTSQPRYVLPPPRVTGYGHACRARVWLQALSHAWQEAHARRGGAEAHPATGATPSLPGDAAFSPRSVAQLVEAALAVPDAVGAVASKSSGGLTVKGGSRKAGVEAAEASAAAAAASCGSRAAAGGDVGGDVALWARLEGLAAAWLRRHMAVLPVGAAVGSIIATASGEPRGGGGQCVWEGYCVAGPWTVWGPPTAQVAGGGGT